MRLPGRRWRAAAVLMAVAALGGGCASAGIPMPFDNQAYNDYLAENGEPPYCGNGIGIGEDATDSRTSNPGNSLLNGFFRGAIGGCARLLVPIL